MILELRAKQKEYSRTKEDKEQKKLGQYFTDSPIAQFMSSQLNLNALDKNKVNILDCGAGYGMLTASTAIHLLENDFNNVSATLYEIDHDVINSLTSVMEEIKEAYTRRKKIFSYIIINDDFVVLRPDLTKREKFDVSVINPPYFKYSVKDSAYSKKASDLYKGDPNIYASFIAITLSSLKNLGQAVVISPRSFLNGLYFKGFRKYLLRNSNFDTVHIFKSRKDVFTDSDILQENIIFKITKTKNKNDHVTISSSKGISDLENPTVVQYPINIIIDNSNDEEIIRIPESNDEYEVLQVAENLKSNFSQEGYSISTGRVVEHRTRNYHSLEHSNNNNVPLIKAHNICLNETKWDGTNKKDLSFKLDHDHEKHLIKNQRCVLLKRFTSKDEKRRLVSSVYESRDYINFVGITNKLNYIYRKDSIISRVEAIGLSTLFNSSFMDNYYRCISGNTQVNATDIRIMKIPTREEIMKLGERSILHSEITHDEIEIIMQNLIQTFKDV